MKDKIKNVWNKQHKNIILVICYIVVAASVYGLWVESLWSLWYVDFIVILAVIGIGCTIGYFYIKSELKAQEPKPQTVEITEELTEEPKEEKSL